MKADPDMCTVILMLPRGLTLTERAPLHAMDSATTQVHLKPGKNLGISREFIMRLVGSDPTLAISKLPFLDFIFIDKATP